MQKSALKTLFKGHAASLALFETVQKYIKTFDSVAMSVTKTQIAFKTKRQFAWVWLPQTWITKAPPDGIVVSFSLDRQLRDTRIKESLEPYPGRFMHHVVIEKPAQFDAKIKAWLREAHTVSEHTNKTN